MIEVTGILPSIVSNDYESRGGNMDNVVVKGNDINIQINKNTSITSLDALWLGNGTYEIQELDDAANLLPEYSIGDIISLDVVKKLLMNSIIKSNAITSVNLIGKVKDKANDMGKNISKKTGAVKKAFTKAKDWFTDNLDKETAQKVIREKGYPRAKVGMINKIDDKDGANWAVLFGNPADRKYYIWTLHRNGNDFRLMTEDDGYTMERFTNSNKCLEKWNQMFPEPETVEEPEENVQEPEEKTQEPKQQDNVIYAEDDLAPRDDDIVLDESQYTVVDNSLKKKKKSKYNGCNVTGYEDGMLGPTVASHKLFSKLIVNTITDFIKNVNNLDISNEEIVSQIKLLLNKISKIGVEGFKICYDSDGSNLVFDFSKTELTTENYRVIFEIHSDRIFGYCNSYFSDIQDPAKKTAMLIKLVSSTLDSILQKQQQ